MNDNHASDIQAAKNFPHLVLRNGYAALRRFIVGVFEVKEYGTAAVLSARVDVMIEHQADVI